MIFLTKTDENGVKTEITVTEDNLAEYFDYQEIMEAGFQNPETLTDVVKNEIANLIHWIIQLRSQSSDELTEEQKNAAWQLKNALEEAGFLGESGCYTANWETFQKWARPVRQKGWAGTNSLVQSLKKEFENVSSFTEEQAVELMVFFIIFSQIRREPTETDLKQLKERMHITPKLGKTYQLHDHEEAFTAHIASHETKAAKIPGERLSLSVLENNNSGPITAPVEGWPLCRTVQPGDDLIVICLDGKPCGYAPRIAASSNHIYLRRDRKLQYTFGKSLKKKQDSVSFFSFGESGLLAADAKGILPGLGKQVFWLRNQWILNADGCVESLGETPVFDAWKDKQLIAFDVDEEQGVAVTFDRSAIDQDGHVLSRNIAAASCCTGNYILLTMDGQAITNLGTIPQRGIHAVCAVSYGFWTSGDYELIEWNEDLEKESVRSICVEEMERCSDGVAVVCLKADGTFDIF